MQAYSAAFARVYQARWTSFAQNAAPRLRAYYESTEMGGRSQTLLDLCCGTGELALHFLDHGYRVTGLDLSPGMLEYARAGAAPYVLAGQARFLQADVTSFSLEETFGLAVSTFDALNHLPDFEALKRCFRSVYAALEAGGTFIFDLNTIEGLRRWTGISIEDSPEMMVVLRSLYDEHSGRAFMRISGFVQRADGLYDRFEETAYEVGFALQPVEAALLETGFRSVRFARLDDLQAPVSEPEAESRIFILAEK